jgi:DNA topoisomerase-3
MGKTLIIAEKPSLAKNICAALSSAPVRVRAGKAPGAAYWENDDTIVASAFGHLLELNDAEDYDPRYRYWQTAALPIIPGTFSYKVKEEGGASSQLRMLTGLIKSKEVDRIVNAGDSDREGEIIIRNILAYAGNTKPVYRLWMPDQTPETIRQELSSMKEDSSYDNLAAEGYARTYIDWLYGINLTRLATKKSGKLLRVGRVTSPIVSAICERERAIRDFVPETYYLAEHSRDGLRLTSAKKFSDREECLRLCEEYNSLPTSVTDRKTEEVVMPRPKLFTLSDLQGVAGKQFKFTPKATLDTLQKLYEAGYVSYPRTNSRYMATAEKQKARDIISALRKAMPETFAGIAFRDSKYIFDDSKIEAHSAITPTYRIPVIRELPLDQQKLYSVILRRFAAAFCREDFRVSRTTLKITNGRESFEVKGDIVLTKGYTVFEKREKKDEPLPDLAVGDSVEPCFVCAEKQTEPPRHYTADSLNTYLKNPFSKEERRELSEDDDGAEEVLGDIELGTEATRAGLIDAAVKSGYITLARNIYGITPLGEYYCDSLARLGIDMTKQRTLELGKSLKQIYRSEKTVDATVRDAESDLSFIVGQAKAVPDAADGEDRPDSRQEAVPDEDAAPVSAEPLGKCPGCGGMIYEYPSCWRCENTGCRRRILKAEPLFVALKTELTPEIASSLLLKGRADVKDMTSKRTGKKFDAVIKVSYRRSRPDFRFEFPEKPEKSGRSGKAASGAQDTASSEKKTASSAKKTASSAKKTASSAKKTASSAKKTAASSKKTASSEKKTASGKGGKTETE